MRARRRALTLVGVCCASAALSGQQGAISPRPASSSPSVAAVRAGLIGTALLPQRTVENRRLGAGHMDFRNCRPGRRVGKRWCASSGRAPCRRGRTPPRCRDLRALAALAGERRSIARPRPSPNPGRPLLHRLNRAEYANAIRDLLALDVDAAALLPPDDSSRRLRQHRRRAGHVAGAARALSRRRARRSARSPSATRQISRRAPRPIDVRGDTSQTQHVEGLPLGTRGGLLVQPHVPARRRVHHQGRSCSKPISARSAGSSTQTSSRSPWTANACIVGDSRRRGGLHRRRRSTPPTWSMRSTRGCRCACR